MEPLTTFGGSRSGIPLVRGSNIQVPYRAGQSFRQKYPDQRTISLTMWLDGSGSVNHAFPAADSRLAFNDNWQSLRAAFITRNATGSVQGQLTRNWYYTQSGSATLVQSIAMGEVAGSMDLTMNGRTGGGFTVDLLLADPHFYGPARSQGITTSGGTITALGEGNAGEGYASAVSSFTVVCSAACTVTNSTAGVSFTLASGPVYPVTVDVLSYTVTDNAGNNVISKFTHSGSRLWMVLLSGSNVVASTAGTATFHWNDAYV